MLDMVDQECRRIDSRFLEPACGNGNFLAEVLRRKLEVVARRNKKNPSGWERDAFVAVASLYGVELLEDNVTECRERLLDIVAKAWNKACGKQGDARFLGAVSYVLGRNILCGDALSLRDADNEPITFSEWSLVFGDKIKRCDYRLSDMLESQEAAPSLFGSDGAAWGYDEDSQSLTAPIVAEFAPTSLYEVVNHG